MDLFWKFPFSLPHLHNCIRIRIRGSFQKNPGIFWQILLYWCFWISIAFFPIGYGFREVMPPLCLIFLFLYYYYDWTGSVLANLKPAWLFLCPCLMTLLGIAFSIDPWQSLLHAGTGVNKAFILPFIAMECVKSKKQLYNLVWAFAFACFWEGLDGLYQTLTGKDFILGYSINAGRLTGSLGDYTVGNYISIALVPALGLYYLLSRHKRKISAAFLCFSILWPAVYLIQGAGTRSGMLCLFSAVFIFCYLLNGLKNIITWSVPFSIPLIFFIFKAERLAPGLVTNDNRWDLWRLAWKVFLEHPWLGAGPGQYNSAFRQLELKPVREAITISHPHNLYLDLLYAHGVTGFSLAMIFLGGFLIWGYKNILPNVRCQTDMTRYWKITSFFWLGYIAWLVNGIFGHDFYRIWWLAEAMSILGIMIGAISLGRTLNSHNPVQQSKKQQTGASLLGYKNG